MLPNDAVGGGWGKRRNHVMTCVRRVESASAHSTRVVSTSASMDTISGLSVLTIELSNREEMNSSRTWIVRRWGMKKMRNNGKESNTMAAALTRRLSAGSFRVARADMMVWRARDPRVRSIACCVRMAVVSCGANGMVAQTYMRYMSRARRPVKAVARQMPKELES